MALSVWAKAGSPGNTGALGFPDMFGANAWGNTGALGFPDWFGANAWGNTVALGLPDWDGANAWPPCNAGALGLFPDWDGENAGAFGNTEAVGFPDWVGANAGDWGNTGALGCPICRSEAKAGALLGVTGLIFGEIFCGDFTAGGVRALRFFLPIRGW